MIACLLKLSKMSLNSLIPSWVSPGVDANLTPDQSGFDAVVNVEQLNPHPVLHYIFYCNQTPKYRSAPITAAVTTYKP